MRRPEVRPQKAEEPTLRDFYVALVEKGIRPTMARSQRKMAAITLTIWKKGVEFDAKQLNRQAA